MWTIAQTLKNHEMQSILFVLMSTQMHIIGNGRCSKKKKREKNRARKTDQQLRALDDLPKDLGFIPRPHMMVNTHL